ncbi:hypothetical protein EES42_33610 [Streptomyces sp. ADI95-17]|nr:hypothetical protein EES42_33610 [Streptomyces sp. ADI95-17]
MSYRMDVSRTRKPSMAMKCMVQIPQPMDAAPSASHPGFRGRSERSDLTVQRRPRAAPRHAIT